MMDILKKAATNDQIHTNSEFINQIQQKMSQYPYDETSILECTNIINQYDTQFTDTYKKHQDDIQNARKLIELCKDFNQPTEVRFGLS